MYSGIYYKYKQMIYLKQNDIFSIRSISYIPYSHAEWMMMFKLNIGYY